MMDPTVDVVIVGGGPAGLSAALMLGRARKKVLLCDAGPRRNAAAEHMHGFVTREGTPPAEFRALGREQLRPYDVTVREVGVHHIEPHGASGFEVTRVDGVRVRCRRVLLATGMVDEVPDLPGIREVWGRGAFPCPYCHGWELRDRQWGMLVTRPEHLEFALFLTGWSPRLVAFTNGALAVPTALRARLERGGVTVEPRRIRRLVTDPQQLLQAVELADGGRLPLEALVVRPPQRQIALVERLQLALDGQGYVQVDTHEETSLPGVHAAGDLASPVQSAVLSAAAGARAAFSINHALNLEAADLPAASHLLHGAR
jgi:thioredoxin reductase